MAAQSSEAANGYREVAEELQGRIRTQSIAVGTLLPTERELSETFGVSRGTIRRALRFLIDSGWASASPNRGVLAKIGPKVDRHAVIGFVDYTTCLEPNLFFSLSRILQARGFHLVHVDSEAAGTEGALEMCAERNFAAAVVWSKTNTPDRERLQKLQQSMPIIAVDHGLRNVVTDVVASETYEGAKQAVFHLVEQGRRRIGISGMLDILDTTDDRLGGYLEGCFQSGLQPQVRDFVFSSTSGMTDSDTWLLEARLQQPDRPDALFVMQDVQVPPIVRAIERLGLRIPEDIAIVTLGTYQVQRGRDLSITTVAMNWELVAQALADRIQLRISDPSAPAVRVNVPTTLVVRRSSGAPEEAWTSPDSAMAGDNFFPSLEPARPDDSSQVPVRRDSMKSSQ